MWSLYVTTNGFHNHWFIHKNPIQINSKIDNQEKIPLHNKSADGKKGKTVFILGDGLVKHVKG